MLKNVSINDWLNIYSRLLASGLSQWVDLLRGNTGQQVHYENRGFYAKDPNPVSYDGGASWEIITTYLPENVQRLEQMLQMCKDAQITCSIVVVPVSDA